MISYTIEKPLPDKAANCGPDELQTFKDWCDHDLKAKCYMQASMKDELKKHFEDAKSAADIHLHFKELFGEQNRLLRHTIVNELITMHMRDGASVHEHGLKLIGLVKKLVGMNLVLPSELSIDVLLLSLPSSFDPFVVNFNINKMEPSLEEMVNMLVTFETTIKKEKSILYASSSPGLNNGLQGKRKKSSFQHPNKNVPLKMQTPNLVVGIVPVNANKTDDACHHF